LQLKNIANTCYRYTERANNVPIAAASYSFSPMFPYAEEIGSLLSENTSSSSRDKATDGLKMLDAKASEAINLIQFGSQIFAQTHNDFIHYMFKAMGKEHVDSRGMDTWDKGPDVEDQSNPSTDFSFMHNGAVGNASTDGPTHAAMPHFGIFHKTPFSCQLLVSSC
jgi:hypothetical protein